MLEMKAVLPQCADAVEYAEKRYEASGIGSSYLFRGGSFFVHSFALYLSCAVLTLGLRVTQLTIGTSSTRRRKATLRGSSTTVAM